MPAREFEDDLQDDSGDIHPVEPSPELPILADTIDQHAVAARLQSKWLQRMEFLIDHGLATSTDLATIARVLLQNGWSLDPKKLPQGLQALVNKVEFDTDTGRPRLLKVI
jgi:hypothetical protein